VDVEDPAPVGSHDLGGDLPQIPRQDHPIDPLFFQQGQKGAWVAGGQQLGGHPPPAGPVEGLGGAVGDHQRDLGGWMSGQLLEQRLQVRAASRGQDGDTGH
jgi:hypothetical protein